MTPITLKEAKIQYKNLVNSSTSVELETNLFHLGMSLAKILVEKNPKVNYFYLIFTSTQEESIIRGMTCLLALYDKSFNIGAILPARTYLEPFNPKKKKSKLMVMVAPLIENPDTTRMQLAHVLQINPTKNVVITSPSLSLDLKKKIKDKIKDKWYNTAFRKSKVNYLSVSNEHLKIKLNKNKSPNKVKLISERLRLFI